jgi:diguanylate cyclase (GGDEF)-like protein
MIRRWSRDELRDLVAGCLLVAVGEGPTTVPMPDWLRDAAGYALEVPYTVFMPAIYTDDRSAVTAVHEAAWQQPGEMIDRAALIRVRTVNGWVQYRLRALNVFDTEARGVLLLMDLEEPIEDPDAVDDPRLRDSCSAQAWFLQHVDETSKILHCEGPTGQIFGMQPDELLGRSLLRFIHVKDHEAVIAMWFDMLEVPGSARTIAVRIVRPERKSLWMSCTVMNRLQDAGAVIVIGSDVTEKVAQDDALRASQQEFRMLAEEVPVAVFRVDDAGQVTYGNNRWFELVGPCGPVRHLADAVRPDHRHAVEAMITELRSPWGPMSATIEAPGADGHRALSIALRVVKASETAPRGLIGEASDVTVTAQLRHVAEHDPLTGTLNRTGFGRHLERRLADDPDDGLLIVFLDLDGFKAVNDQYGHVIGDEVLRAVAHRLRLAVRPADLVGRFGGDEFVVLCHDAAPGAEGLICARIEEALVAPVQWPGGRWYPQASIGTARRRPGDDPTTLIRRADEAMYEVKRAHHARDAQARDAQTRDTHARGARARSAGRAGVTPRVTGR